MSSSALSAKRATRRLLWPMRAALAAFVLMALVAPGCERTSSSAPTSDLSSLPVTLPDGSRIRAEVAVTGEQQRRGLMFRDALAPDAGMLFVFASPSPRTFWMFQTRIPLDILWLDADRRVVEISAHTPPCPARDARDCPSYGGAVESKYVLEMAAGQAQARGVAVGDEILF